MRTHRRHIGHALIYVLLIFVTLAAIGGIGYVTYKYTKIQMEENEKEEETEVVTQDQILNITFQEFHEKFGPESPYTEMVKKESFKKGYLGKYVAWKGKVADVEDAFWKGGLTLKVKHRENNWQEDVIVYMRDEEKPEVAMLKKGDEVTYIAKLRTISSMLFPYRLSDGQIE